MDKTFNDLVLDELRTLVSELENGQEPSNICLHEVVCADVLRDININK